MWFALFSFRQRGGRRFVLPFPLFLLWPMVAVLFVLTSLIALLTLSRRTWSAARFLLICPFRLSGASVQVTARDGGEFAMKLV